MAPSTQTTLKQPIWARNWPFFLIYTTYTLLLLPFKLSYYILRYSLLPRTFRPLPTWTFQQSISVAVIRLVFKYVGTVEINPFRFSLKPGSEKERFVLIPPFETSEYGGAAKPTEDVFPQKIAGVWSPDVPPSTAKEATTTEKKEEKKKKGKRVFMHFHGGGYVMFDCRDLYFAFGARMLLEASKGKARVFAVRYRLCSEKGLKKGSTNKFPAALQDAVTAYMYLVKRLGIDPRDVVLSGDSAGGNLALALFRYLEDQEGERKLPLPGGVVLWSPWVDLSVPLEMFERMENSKYDMILPESTGWGYRTFIPEDRGAEDAYISPVKKAIRTKVPIWVNWGGREVFGGAIREFVEGQQRVGLGKVGTYVIDDAPHDLLGCGEAMGWVKETRGAVEDAVRFLDDNVAANGEST
ncbi:Alpha/Beta hydrolase protein [Cladorrhinum sp. PSN332]|nr:Alpha/Beta hydrolase protein [Cladorrhinum sp. PSN332]